MVRKQAAADRQKRRIARLGAALTVVALACGPSPVRAADDPLLSRLAGEWIGNGTVKMNAKATAERIYCHVIATLVDGKSIEQKGRCSVASNSGALAGTIAATGGGRYQGIMEAPTVGSTSFTGTAAGARLTLSASFVDARTKKQRNATIVMSFADGRYRVVTSNSGDDGSYVASDIVFTRK